MTAYIYNSDDKLMRTIYNIKRIDEVRTEFDTPTDTTIIFYHSRCDFIEHNFCINTGERVSFQ